MAEVIYTRKQLDSEVNNLPIEDGQIIYTKQGHVFMDFEEDRIPMQNTPDNQMSDVSTNTVDNKTIKSYVDNKIQIVRNEIDKEKLWVNPLPDTSFASQEITLSQNLSNFGGYEILYRQSTSNQRIMTTGIIPIGHGTILILPLFSPYYRPTNPTVSGTSITFEDCHVSTNTNDNTMVIPYMVIGHKTTIFN